MTFVNLHGHSHYSLLDGFGSPGEIVRRAKELGYPAAALTDHGVTYGLIELYKEAKKEGIKPILGCELYVAPRTMHDKEAKIDVKPYHLTTLAKNNKGYENLLKMVTKAHLEGFYYKPRVDYQLLEQHSEGLIVLSGCLAAHLPRLILSENEPEIHELVKKFIKIFGKENYYLEIQYNPNMPEQAKVNEKLKLLAKEYDLGLVLTYDSHYPRPEDKEVHDVLLCIQTGSTIDQENRMRYEGDFSLKDINEIKEHFKDVPEAIENTVKIAEKCDVDFDFGVNLIPAFDTPEKQNPKDYLRYLCETGLKERLGEIPKDYQERLDYELSVVDKMGFNTYFLIVHDFVKYAKDQKIVVGPGRGSAAGAIIAWSLRITDVDPIKYGLFFERFLNPERVSMPDIDIDFADNRRDEVLSYVIEKYGRSNVAQIITFGTMAPKAAIRDTGRALGYPYAEVDALSKAVPPAVLGKYAPLNKSIEDDPELSSIYKNDPRARKVLNYAKKLEGTVRHIGTHACAVIISEKELPNYTALQYGAGGRGEIVTQYDAKPLESLGLLKMDFLGLRNLTVIEKTLEIVKERTGEEIDMLKLNLEDEETFKLLQRGETTGVFQLESGGMRRYLKELKPTQFEDIVAMGALYRPGPMEWIPTYIEGKHHPDKVKYLDDSFKEILAPTYGVAVYQEQILQLARDFAGFSLGEADILRKAVGKKDPKLLEEQRTKFINGAVENGADKKFSEEVFKKVVEPFAGYGFNKAHAVCYGLIAYQTAYLKAHYPTAFMTALLCSDANNTDRVVVEIKECIDKGIEVLPPSINESFAEFAMVDDKKIRFGLLAIKGLGDGPIEEIIKERTANGQFKSIEDMASRLKPQVLNKKVIQAMAYSGALDEIGERNLLAENYSALSKYSKQVHDTTANGQTDIFGMLPEEELENCSLELDKVPPASKLQRLKWEKDILGLYVSGHPLQGLGQYISRRASLISKLTPKHLDKKIKIVGAISDLRKIMTKAGKYMATFTIEDPSARIRAVMFPRSYQQYGALLSDDNVIGFSGKVDNKRGQCQFICEAAKKLSLPIMIENAQEHHIYDPNDKSYLAVRDLDDIWNDNIDQEEESSQSGAESQTITVPKSVTTEQMQKLKQILMDNQGDTEVELFLESADKRIKLPFKINLTTELKTEIKALIRA